MLDNISATRLGYGGVFPFFPGKKQMVGQGQTWTEWRRPAGETVGAPHCGIKLYFMLTGPSYL